MYSYDRTAASYTYGHVVERAAELVADEVQANESLIEKLADRVCERLVEEDRDLGGEWLDEVYVRGFVSKRFADDLARKLTTTETLKDIAHWVASGLDVVKRG